MFFDFNVDFILIRPKMITATLSNVGSTVMVWIVLP
jgi:hypothetical protein